MESVDPLSIITGLALVVVVALVLTFLVFLVKEVVDSVKNDYKKGQ
jgi:hypothetical protein